MDRNNPGGGGMTGATGDLTPDDSTEAFEPGEVREVASGEAHAEVTKSQGRHAPAQAGDLGAPGDADTPEGDPAPRDAGYGSTHGLSPEDPAYAMDTPAAAPEVSAPRDTDTHMGGDELEHEPDHF